MHLLRSDVLTARITITGPVKAQLKRRFVESQHLQQNQTNNPFSPNASETNRRILINTCVTVCPTHASPSVAPYPSEYTNAETPTITNGTP